MTRLIYSHGGYAREFVKHVRAAHPGEDVVFIDDAPSDGAISYEVARARYAPGSAQIIIGFAGAALRKSKTEQVLRDGYTLYSVQAQTAQIGPNVHIGEGSILSDFSTLTADARIGQSFQCNIYSYVAHDCIIGEHVILVNSVSLAGHVVIGDWSILGGLSAVHQFVHIGKHVMVGGGSMVRQDIPPFITVARTPLAFDGVNSIGLKRRGFSHERIERIQSTYRLLYQSGRNVTQAKEALKDNKDPDSQAILDFIAKSERGILLKS
ncbi:MAG: hypothetical protein P8P01_00865 [Schleiferiaceae bacterium]|nr:hypothetical protein [Schleiferiaceae bacterium]